MPLDPNPLFVSFTTYGPIKSVMLGYRDARGEASFSQVELNQHQATVLVASANDMVSTCDAGVALFSSGWTIYPRVEIPNVEALWTP